MIPGQVYVYGYADKGVFLDTIQVETDGSALYRAKKYTTKARMVKIGVAHWDEQGDSLPEGEHRIYVQDDHPDSVMPSQVHGPFAADRESAIARIEAELAQHTALQSARDGGNKLAQALAQEIRNAFKRLGLEADVDAEVADDGTPGVTVRSFDPSFAHLMVTLADTVEEGIR